MKYRTFLKRALGGAAASLAAFYVPSRPWNIAVPRPQFGPQGGIVIPKHLVPFLDNLQREGILYWRDYAPIASARSL